MADTGLGQRHQEAVAERPVVDLADELDLPAMPGHDPSDGDRESRGNDLEVRSTSRYRPDDDDHRLPAYVVWNQIAGCRSNRPGIKRPSVAGSGLDVESC